MIAFLDVGFNGTIPAWAGEPASQRSVHHQPRDHPRVGGGTD